MKKLMFATIASMAVAGFAIESSNTVGYSTDTSGANNNFITVPFNAVGYNTADIQAIGISDGGAGTVGWGSEAFEIWEGLPTLREGAGFFYWDASMDPAGEATGCYWGDDTCAKVVYPLPAGQGVVINCAAGLTISIDPPYSAE